MNGWGKHLQQIQFLWLHFSPALSLRLFRKPEQLQAGHHDSGHHHRMRTFNKTKWKPCYLFLPSWHAGRQTKGWLTEGSPLSGSGIVGSGREGQWFQVFSIPCLCLAASFYAFLVALCAQFTEGTDSRSLLRDMTCHCSWSHYWFILKK